jgi:hypothetical protein
MQPGYLPHKHGWWTPVLSIRLFPIATSFVALPSPVSNMDSAATCPLPRRLPARNPRHPACERSNRFTLASNAFK